MQMRKKCTFSNILQKVKSYFFANTVSIFLRVIPIKFETLKPPSAYVGNISYTSLRSFVQITVRLSTILKVLCAFREPIGLTTTISRRSNVWPARRDATTA